MSNKGFVKLSREDANGSLSYLAKKPFASHLYQIIALRAKRAEHPTNAHLKLGECLIGDYKSYGMSLQNYRTAKKQLAKAGLASFVSSTKGTVATITSTDIYDINLDDSQHQSNNQNAKIQHQSNNLANNQAEVTSSCNADNNATTFDTPNNQANTEVTIKPDFANKQLTTNKNIRSIKEEKNYISTGSQGAFTPPTLEQVQKFCKDEKIKININHFLCHYEMTNWKKGTNYIHSWEAAVKAWWHSGNLKQEALEDSQSPYQGPLL